MFLQRLASHPKLRQDHNFHVFLEFDKDVRCLLIHTLYSRLHVIGLMSVWAKVEKSVNRDYYKPNCNAPLCAYSVKFDLIKWSILYYLIVLYNVYVCLFICLFACC